MKKIIILTGLWFTGMTCFAQTIINRDPAIAQMVSEVNADSLHSYINQLVGFGTRHTLSVQTDPKRGIGAAREWVLGKFREFARNTGGRMEVYLDTTTLPADGKRVNKPVVLGNCMAVLKGTDPADKRIFLITGHLDNRVSDIMNTSSETPGANDDGSGVAAVIESARVLSKRAFPATIVFVAVSGEEQGLFGAEFLAKKARKENWALEAVLNNDIVGSNNSSETNIIDNTKLRVFSEGLPFYELDKNAGRIRNLGGENDGRSRQLARYVKEIGERYVDQMQVVMIYRNDRFLRGGDHTPFVENGFPAVRLTEMNENFNHQHQDIRNDKGIQYGDLPEFMDFEYLRKNTAVNLATLANLAAAPGVPVKFMIDVKELSNFTALSWTAPATGKAFGYYILMRETTAPQWQKKFFTTATTIRLPYSKDNYLFAIQSVDAAGHESLTITPEPGR